MQDTSYRPPKTIMKCAPYVNIFINILIRTRRSYAVRMLAQGMLENFEGEMAIYVCLAVFLD